MKLAISCAFLAFLIGSIVQAADLPTISLEHLYYLRSRGEVVRRFSGDEMVEYCVAQKIGGCAFEDLYSQLFSMRIELVKLQRVESVSEEDSRLRTLKKTYAAEYNLLSDEAQNIQKGLIREGQIASQTLESISRAQQQAR